MSENEVNKLVVENAWLVAERGWRAHFVFNDGESFNNAFITATDKEQNVVVIERPGEREIPPRIVYLKDVKSVEPIWN